MLISLNYENTILYNINRVMGKGERLQPHANIQTEMYISVSIIESIYDYANIVCQYIHTVYERSTSQILVQLPN